jgi:hypothetical protein
MDIKQKSIGVLIDELITTDIKCWFAQEKLLSGKDDHEVAEAARDAQALNARRNQLIRAIDEVLGQGSVSLLRKSYDK